MNMQVSTFFALLAEFGTAEIELERVCKKYFGLDTDKAKARAARQQLPVPAHRGGSQKSGWLIKAADLAEHIDHQRSRARDEWERVNL